MPWLRPCDFVDLQLHLPIGLSGTARLSGWIRSAGEALLEGSRGESCGEVFGPLESMSVSVILRPYRQPSSLR